MSQYFELLSEHTKTLTNTLQVKVLNDSLHPELPAGTVATLTYGHELPDGTPYVDAVTDNGDKLRLNDYTHFYHEVMNFANSDCKLVFTSYSDYADTPTTSFPVRVPFYLYQKVALFKPNPATDHVPGHGAEERFFGWAENLRQENPQVEVLGVYSNDDTVVTGYVLRDKEQA